MGASFETLRCGPVSPEKLRRWYDDQLDDMRRESGEDPYNGTLTTCEGLSITSQVFKTHEEAHEWLSDEAEKWGPALAVQVGDFSKEFPRTKADKDLLAKLNEVEKELENFLADIVKRAQKAKSKTRGCAHCGSSIAVKYMLAIPVGVQAHGDHFMQWREPTDCIVCGHNLLLTDTDKKRRISLQKKQKELLAKVNDAVNKSPRKAYWLIGGRVAC